METIAVLFLLLGGLLLFGSHVPEGAISAAVGAFLLVASKIIDWLRARALAEQLDKLATLRDKGALSAEEFADLKRQALAEVIDSPAEPTTRRRKGRRAAGPGTPGGPALPPA